MRRCDRGSERAHLSRGETLFEFLERHNGQALEFAQTRAGNRGVR